jgi:2',3'-cyclic-nucleotide 2'-phosphodiesterase (5'-nucleotidase family)
MRCLRLVTPMLFALCCSLSFAFPAGAVPVTILGTNDWHGRVERVAEYSGYVSIVRAQAKKAGGAVVVVDGGDMFQGTLESNLVEGKSMVEALNVLKPDAVAIGNHEFDFGPAGPLAMPRMDAKTNKPLDDPRGALKARAAEAKFPFLAANLIDDDTGKPVKWPNVKPSHLVDAGGGIKVGVIGVTTKDTAFTTAAANFKGLRTDTLREVIAAEADALRKKGAHVIVVAAHAGGKCNDVSNPTDTSSCVADDEGFQLAYSLPAGLIDAFVAGHTHATVAHVVNGIPVIESWANGRGFGRIDLDVDKKTKKVTLVKVHPPQQLCKDHEAATCELGEYMGEPVKRDERIAKLLVPYVAEAMRVKNKKLGVKITREVKRAYDEESALGNLFADIMLQASPGADVALMNGGGIRANLPAGELTYGHIFEMMPFDNRFAKVTATGADLRRWLATNLSARKGGILSVAGVIAEVTCEGKKADVVLKRLNGSVIGDADKIVISTSDFLATGGEATKLPPGSVILDPPEWGAEPIREELSRTFEKRAHNGGATLDGEDRALFDPTKRRLRPGRCKG